MHKCLFYYDIFKPREVDGFKPQKDLMGGVGPSPNFTGKKNLNLVFEGTHS
jgi:hypothetical protein